MVVVVNGIGPARIGVQSRSPEVIRKMLFSAAIVPLVVAAHAHAAISFDQVDVEYWVGSGDLEAMLIVDWQADRTLAFGYRFSAFDAPTDFDLFEAVHDHSDRFYREWVAGMEEEAIFGIGWDTDLDGFAKDDPDDWYEEGWFENGFWGQYVSDDGESWSFGGGLGAHDLEDGDWIGWSWAPNFEGSAPDVPLIPGPAALASLLGGLLIGPRRWRDHR
jgi:hypothetical protein